MKEDRSQGRQADGRGESVGKRKDGERLCTPEDGAKGISDRGQ